MLGVNLPTGGRTPRGQRQSSTARASAPRASFGQLQHGDLGRQPRMRVIWWRSTSSLATCAREVRGLRRRRVKTLPTAATHGEEKDASTTPPGARTGTPNAVVRCASATICGSSVARNTARKPCASTGRARALAYAARPFAGPALVLAELGGRRRGYHAVAPPHVDAEDGAPRGPVEPVLRRPGPPSVAPSGRARTSHRLRVLQKSSRWACAAAGAAASRLPASRAEKPRRPAPAPQRSSGSRPRHAAASPSAAQPTRRIAGVRKRARASTAARNG